MRSLYCILIVLIFSMITACVSSQSNPELNSSLTIGILNDFPDHPQYVKRSILIAIDRSNRMDELRFKSLLTTYVEKYLVSKNYKAVEVQSRDAMKDGSVDMIIEIVPRQVFKQESCIGYGFSDRSGLLKISPVKKPPASYVCLSLNLFRKNKLSVKKTDRIENFSKLDIEHLPENFGALSESQVKHFSQNLESNIKETISQAMPMLGL